MADETALVRETVRGLFAHPGDEPVVVRLEADGWRELAGDDLALWAILAEEAAGALHASPVADYFAASTLGLDPTVSVVHGAGYVHGDGWPAASGYVSFDGPEVALHDAAEVDAVEGIDATAGLGRVTALAKPSSRRSGRAVERAAAGILVLHAAQLDALARAMLDLAVRHVTTREQFGRAIGTFQAVKHQLADARVALSAGESAVRHAAAEPDQAEAAVVARILAARGAFEVGRAGQQVTGAMGFTWEVPLHRYLRRAYAIDLLDGPWERQARELGRRAIERGAVPRLGSV